VVRVRDGLGAGFVVLIVLLTAFVQIGLGVLPAVAGLVCGVVLCVVVTRGAVSMGACALGPADLVTLARATLACALAGLVVDPSLGDPAAAVVVPLAVLALLSDAVDGRVARLTGTMSAFGARFDGEADAFLLLVLSAFVAPAYGWWVLAIGGARYAFGLAGWAWMWMRAQLPFRYWRKVVTAVQGIALVIAASNVLPRAVAYAALFGALALLAESFGRDVLWLWRRRPPAPVRSMEATVTARLRVP
jgi:phosphatidylglycerophosphate synthase